MPGIANLIDEYLGKGLLLDTNLMLLLVVGWHDIGRIESFKRTRQYSVADFSMLVEILKRFARRVTTPNILTEVDNLCRQLPEHEHAAVSNVLSHFVRSHFEVHLKSDAVMRSHRYVDLGLTDSVTLEAANELLVLTDDFRLSNVLSAHGIDALNINHIRGLGAMVAGRR